jgi:lipopolysaccharide/colanic/teichoic acid biosynthesis glycosyltransferase
MYQKFFKPAIDTFLAILIVVVLSPLFVGLLILLFVAQKANPLFVQERVGLNNQVFKLVKFKTMSDEKDERGKLLPDEQRLTKIGKRIRSTSLDELPQLWNVLKGDMSLVGPRPLLVKYLPLYTDRQARRHQVKPGITGWAQVNGRNAISWEEKFELDVYYVENVSFVMDVKILWHTFIKVLKREGINSKSSVTMIPFTGTKSEEEYGR